jgi:hypothetical protein
MDGNIFDEGRTMIAADPTLLPTGQSDIAIQARDFIINVMADNRRQ